MKKLPFFLLVVAIGTLSIISSCSYNPASNPPTPTAKLTFKKDFHGNYDVFVVDTTDKSGNNGDKILNSTRVTVQDLVVDTGLTFQGKSHVTKIRTYQGTPPVPVDSEYFYQDPNGDLYRYNFGFTILNQFTFLTQAIGGPVDVGWVLAAKLSSSTGITWVARSTDTVIVQIGGGIPVFLNSDGEMMADTTIMVSTETVKAHHARTKVTASTPPGYNEGGTVYIDSYYSTDLGAVVEDLFRHVTLAGPLLNQQAQGKFKIMTSHY